MYIGILDTAISYGCARCSDGRGEQNLRWQYITLYIHHFTLKYKIDYSKYENKCVLVVQKSMCTRRFENIVREAYAGSTMTFIPTICPQNTRLTKEHDFNVLPVVSFQIAKMSWHIFLSNICYLNGGDIALKQIPYIFSFENVLLL